MEIPSSVNPSVPQLNSNLNIANTFNNMNVMDNIISDALNNYKNDNLEIRKTVNN